MKHSIPTSGVAWAVAFAFALAALLIAAAPASAQSEVDMFVVTGVPVSESGKSAVEAREKAIEAGQIKALRTVMERLTSPSELQRLPQVAPSEVPPMVQAIEINDERTAGSRYRANMTVRFFPEAVRRVLRSSAVAFADKPAPPALVLPLYSADGADNLWEEPNPWREAWTSHGRGSPLVPLIVPYGDLDDVQAISARDVLEGAPAPLETIARRYDVEDVVIAHATRQPGGGLEVEISRYWPGGVLTPVDRFSSDAGDQGMQAAVDRATGRMADAVRSGAPARPGTAVAGTSYGADSAALQGGASLNTRISYAGLPQWVQIRNALARIANVAELQIESVSASDAQVVLNYLGTTDQLRTALGQSNLALRNDGPYWALAVMDPSRPVVAAQPGYAAPQPGYAAPAEPPAQSLPRTN